MTHLRDWIRRLETHPRGHALLSEAMVAGVVFVWATAAISALVTRASAAMVELASALDQLR